VKRRLRLELAGAQSLGEVAKEVRKRLTAIARSRSFIDCQNRKALIEDLEAQRRSIVSQIANADLIEALELMWRFMALANTVFERCDDSSGAVMSIFRTASRDLGEIASVAKVDPEILAERAFKALNENEYGQYDELIGVLSPALGPPGLERLKERFFELSKAPSERPKDRDRKVIGWGTGGPLPSMPTTSPAADVRAPSAWPCRKLQTPKATLMPSSRSKVERPGPCQELRPKSPADFSRGVVPRRLGALSMPSMKPDLVGSRSNGRRYVSM
jgi:hypothetical protein